MGQYYCKTLGLSFLFLQTDPEFKKRAYESVVKLQAYDAEHIKGWNLICDVSRKEFEKIYKRLNVTLKERGESFYQKKMESIVKELKVHTNYITYYTDTD